MILQYIPVSYVALWLSSFREETEEGGRVLTIKLRIWAFSREMMEEAGSS